MNIYDELRKDHKKVLSLLDQLIEAKESDLKSRERLVEEITDELIPHARAEEAVLYNSIRDVTSAGGAVGDAYREHLQAETLLRSLQVTDVVNINWVSGAKKLKENLEHHIAEEEGRLFSTAKKLFSDEEAKAMAEVFNQMKPMVRKQSFVGKSLDLMVNMMPARLRDAFSKWTPMSGETQEFEKKAS